MACRDLRHHHDFARILGLGGKHYVDYSPNVRKPKLRLEQDDYVNFGRERTACLLPLAYQHLGSLALHAEDDLTMCLWGSSICLGGPYAGVTRRAVCDYDSR